MVNRLSVGAEIPDFRVTTMTGRRLTPEVFSGQRVLLAFRRYAACPVCNQHLATYRVRGAELATRKIKMYAIFHSEIGRLETYFDPDELPFEVVSDPDFALYNAFGVAPNMFACMRPSSLKAAVSASKSGLGADKFGEADGTSFMIPANFMIAEGKLAAVHYGRDLGDAWSVDRSLEIARELWTV